MSEEEAENVKGGMYLKKSKEGKMVVASPVYFYFDTDDEATEFIRLLKDTKELSEFLESAQPVIDMSPKVYMKLVDEEVGSDEEVEE